MSTAMWKLEKDLCRCCHAEGAFKNLAEPCFTLGQEEIYFDMLQESLDIKIVPITGLLGDATYTICESCIIRLRDASNFKRQVLDCEERFKDMYSRNLIRGFEVKVEPLTSDPEDLKIELQSMDDDNDDAFLNFDASEDDMEDTERSVAVVLDTKGKGKGKAKPKTKAKPKQPVKKKTPKKTIKEEQTEVTEAAVSGEKKKGYTQFTLEVEEDGSHAFVCDDCGGRYKKRNHFSQHYRHVHLKMRPKLRACYLCNLKVPAHLRAFHLESVHGWPAPSCGACGKKFAYPFQVLKHQKIYHMGEKSYKCEQCDMKFDSKYRLQQHSIKHTNLRKHKCSFCEKSFRWRNNLKTHVMIHLNEKAHACSLCDAAFVQLSSLKYHIGKWHPETM